VAEAHPLAQTAPNRARVEGALELHGGAGVVRRVQRVDDAVDVVQWQRVQDAVLRRPRPRLRKARRLRR
jgi:hypothetical protein